MIMTKPAFIYVLPIYILFWILRFIFQREEKREIIIGGISCIICAILLLGYCGLVKNQCGKFELTNIFDLNEYMQVSSNNNKQNLNSTKEQQIRNIYEENLKNDIKAKIKSKGYDVSNISLDIENNNQYTLKTINITLKNSNPSNINTNNIQVVNEIKIEIENSESNHQKETHTESTVSISNKEKNALKQYLSGIYEIEEKNIIIN